MEFKSSEIKDDFFILILMIISIPLTGELKLYPFHDTFRISFSTTIFLFFLLWIKKIPLILYGFIVGISVLLFRIAKEIFVNSNFQLYHSFLINFPAFFYYLIFSMIFFVANINNFHNKPLKIGCLAVISDLCSGLTEILIRYFLFQNPINIKTICLLFITAVVRSFFVLGFFNIIKLNEIREKSQQQSMQNEYMLLLISSLYEETIQLKKTITYAEDITTKCYNLYRKVHDAYKNLENKDEFSEKLLGIAGEIHEIKKDNQRIYSGLSKIISSKNYNDFMAPSEIVKIVINTNRKYSSFLKKDVKFESSIDASLPHIHVYTMMSILNNLVSNSIEAFDVSGNIKIMFEKKDAFNVKIEVVDNGPGIPERKQKSIFKAGYTTKFDDSGKASTGMGLAYVNHVVNDLKGCICLKSGDTETRFRIELPIGKLIEKR